MILHRAPGYGELNPAAAKRAQGDCRWLRACDQLPRISDIRDKLTVALAQWFKVMPPIVTPMQRGISSECKIEGSPRTTKLDTPSNVTTWARDSGGFLCLETVIKTRRSTWTKVHFPLTKG